MKFVFSANNGTSGAELWVSDGTAAGTVLLEDLVPGTTGASPFNFVSIGGGKLVFVTVSGGTANLWISNGASGGTSVLQSFAVSSPADNPTGFTPFGAGFLFTGRDTTNGRELWISDGTAAGTHLLSNIMAGSASSGAGGYRVLGSKVVFAADNGTTGKELWVTDGTAAGTQQLKDINLNGNSDPQFGVQIGNKLVFSANDGSTGRELWITDGTTGGTFQVKDINLGIDSSFASRFTALGNKAIFTAVDPVGGSESWVTDGTPTGTMRLADIQPGAVNSSIESFTVAGTKAYFTAINAVNDDNTAFELWSTDGTPGGTFMIKGMPRGGYNTASEPLIAFGDKIFFVAYDPVNGKELWISDGTTAGTHIVKDINPGTAHGVTFSAFRPVVIGGKLYFTANDGVNGNELWVSDGTAAGTVLLKNINSGVADSFPSYLLDISPAAAPGSPTNIALSATSVQEFRANGTAIGNLSATDPDAGETFTYTLLNNAGGRFSIVGAQLRVANGLLLDFEQAASHGITVRVTDSDGNTFDKAFTISVGDVNPENVTGDAGANTLVGGALADTFHGGAGNDTLDGGAGADNLYGEADNDTYTVDNAGDQVIELINQGYDTINTTLLSYALGANAERVNFTGSGNFVGTGNPLANRFQGGAGDDRFVDVLGGADIFSGGNGVDTVDFRSSATGAVLNFTTNVHGGAAAGDSYSGIEKFLGSNTSADTMTMGGTGRALFVGGGGGDMLTGGVKNDQLIGQGGNDTLIGGNDRDSLDGGTGNDTMTGGAAGDVFVFIDAAFGQDTITDYQDGLDSFKVFSAVADNIADFTITGNGTTSVRLTLASAPTNFITVNGAAPITIAADDFVFY